jgi:hypothetical protein
MRIFMRVAALVGWVGLILQLYLMIAQSAPGAVVSTVVTFLSFFTILSNLAVTLTWTFAGWLPESKLGKFFSRPGVQAAVVVYIVIVGVIYTLLLRHYWDPKGAQKLADSLLHDVVPILYAAYWLFLAPKNGLRWKSALTWLIFPGVYLLYLLARGAIVSKYPYPFIDVTELGYPRMFLNSAGFLGIFLGLGLIVVAYARWRERLSLVAITQEAAARQNRSG